MGHFRQAAHGWPRRSSRSGLHVSPMDVANASGWVSESSIIIEVQFVDGLTAGRQRELLRTLAQQCADLVGGTVELHATDDAGRLD